MGTSKNYVLSAISALAEPACSVLAGVSARFGAFLHLAGARAVICVMPHGLHPRAHSSGCSCHPLELDQPTDVVAEVHHTDLEPRPHDTDGAHDLAAHRVLLVAEH